MKKAIVIIATIFLSVFIICLSFNYKSDLVPHVYYQVYLNDEMLGVIESKSELNKYINEQNSKYKKKYKIKDVYAPIGLIMKKVETYSDELTDVPTMYKMIAEKQPFTIEGYKFNIKSEDKNITVYTLTQEIFDEAITNTINAFVGKDVYNSFLNDEQVEIETTGSKTENIYIDENITVKKTKISVNEKIYTNATDLSRFLLFGEEEQSIEYIVKDGDTIADVAFDNKISVEEFLISNPEFTNESNLLFAGQNVKISATDPQVSVVMEKYNVEDQVVKYQTEIQYDSKRLQGLDEVIQEGSDGLERVSQRIKYVNGTINYITPISKEELEPPVNEVILKGEKYVPTQGSTSNWAWPTTSGYIITSGYVYRINPITGYRELHAALDIAGTGMGSPIYAATNGVVSESSFRYQDGNYVCINHNNGYYTCYCHMSRRNVEPGQTVARGSVIGYVGMTGWATGPHLHFEVWVGKPWMGGYRINPWIMLNR